MESQPATISYLIGTYTERLPHVDGHAEGVLAADYSNGRLGAPSTLAISRNPSFVAVSSDRRCVYVVNETVEFEGEAGGGVTAYRRDGVTGSLTELGTRLSLGVEPAHLALDPAERFLLVANYRSGSLSVYPRESDGALGDACGHVQHSGSSVHPDRQTGPHAHMIEFDPVTGDVLVPDLGMDAVLVYRLSEDGQLEARPELTIAASPGAGPRHLAFHPDGESLFLVNELDNTLTLLRRRDGRFRPELTVSTLPEGFSAHSQAAAVRVSASGNLVLASNRGPDSDSVAVFRFDPAKRTVELAGLTPSGGREPREMVLTPGGSHLLVANQDSDVVNVFAVDEEAASLRPVSRTPVPTPVCLVAL